MARRDIIITGSIAFDHIMNLPSRFSNYIMPDKIHMLNVSFNAQNMRKEMGGTGGNIAYTLGLLGLKPTLLAPVGNDFTEYRQKLISIGVDCKSVKTYPRELSAVGFCITDQDDNQIWSFSFNAGAHITELKLPPTNNKTFVVISPSSPKGINHFVNQCHQRKLSYLYDPAFAIPELTKTHLIKGIEGAAIIIGNDYEIELVKRKTNLSTEEMVKNGRILVTTLGSKGSKIELKTNNGKLKTISIPPTKPKNASDPTGAGDAFRGGFLSGYIRGLDLEICGRMGSLASVYTVEKYGTTTHKYTTKQFQSRYQQSFKQPLTLKIL